MSTPKYTREELAEKSHEELVEIAMYAINLVQVKNDLAVDRRAWAVDRALKVGDPTPQNADAVIAIAEKLIEFILKGENDA